MEAKYIHALKENSAKLINEWHEIVIKSTSLYSGLPQDESRVRVSEHFWSMIAIYEYKQFEDLTAFLSNMALVADSNHINYKEMHVAFLAGQSIILNFLDEFRGGKLHYCSNCRDVTESFNTTQSIYAQIQKELVLKDAETSFENEIREKDITLSILTESTADAVIIFDEDLCIKSWNRGAEEMYQYSKSEMLNQSITKIVPDTAIEKGEIDKLLKIVLSTGSLKNIQTQRVRKDGKKLTVNITSTRLTDSKGNILGISAIHRDITERLQLEQEIREQEQLLSSIVDNSVDAIIGLNLENNIISWNKGAETIFGYSREEMEGKSFTFLFPPDIDHEAEIAKMSEMLSNEGSIQNYECKRITKTNKRIVTSLTRSLIRDKRGKIIGSSAIIRDISEYKKLKLQMRHSEKLAVVGQLTAGIAHEVGNPLTSISSLIQVIARQNENEELSDKLQLIKKQTDRITKLIREMVNFSQPSNFKVKMTDLNAVINEAVAIINFDKRTKNCKLQISLQEDIPILELPEDQILQVFINILLNAVDAVPKGRGKISIESKRKNSTLITKFHDNGPGIPKDIMDKIFDPFFTTKSVGKGTGLGLWVSYGIMESVNGNIKVKSNSKHGTTFKVEIPIIGSQNE